MNDIDVLTTASTAEAITLAEAKAHMRIDFTDDDTYIGNLITAAREYCEIYTNRAIITQSRTLYLDYFYSDVLYLRRPPLQSVTSLKYYDTDNALQTLATSVYEVDTDSEPARIYLKPSQSFPATYDKYKAIEVLYVCGYGDSSEDVPDAIRQAMLMHIAHMYENREQTVIGLMVNQLPMAYQSLLSSYRIRNI